MGWGRLN